ncbi:hypothetical protein LPJ71_004993, partial [Coemansia sp. S17]
YWYKRFEQGDFNLEDRPRSGRNPNYDNDELTEIFHDEIVKNPSITWEELATVGLCSTVRAKHIVAERLGYRR